MTTTDNDASLTPDRVAYWYNREARSWVVQVLNAAGHQIGETTYLGGSGRGGAIREAAQQADALGVPMGQR